MRVSKTSLHAGQYKGQNQGLCSYKIESISFRKESIFCSAPISVQTCNYIETLPCKSMEWFPCKRKSRLTWFDMGYNMLYFFRLLIFWLIFSSLSWIFYSKFSEQCPIFCLDITKIHQAFIKKLKIFHPIPTPAIRHLPVSNRNLQQYCLVFPNHWYITKIKSEKDMTGDYNNIFSSTWRRFYKCKKNDEKGVN